MSFRAFLTGILETIFVVHTPRAAVIKLTLLLLLSNGLFFYVEQLFLGFDYTTFWTRFGIRTLVATPVIAAVCAIMTYLFYVQQQLSDLAMTDPLTKLPNRRAFIERTKAAFVQGGASYLLLIDADHFKRINDTFGHPAGDACLIAIADHLNAAIGPKDLIGRIGGEEFAILLADSDKTELIQIGKHLTRAITVQTKDMPGPVRLTLSIGATNATFIEPVETTLQRADVALYQAKKSGRARMVVGPRAKAEDSAA